MTLLVIVFITPLIGVHNVMTKSKENALKKINSKTSEIHIKLFESDEDHSKNMKILKDLYYVSEKLDEMAVWPLDLRITSKFIATSAFPLLGTIATVILRYILVYLGINF